MIEKNYGTGVCCWCNKPYRKAQGLQKYCCTKCKRDAQHHQVREWYREQRELMKKEQEWREKRKKSTYSSYKELADMNERARAAGLSYGKYVALLREGRVQFGRSQVD